MLKDISREGKFVLRADQLFEIGDRCSPEFLWALAEIDIDLPRNSRMGRIYRSWQEGGSSRFSPGTQTTLWTLQETPFDEVVLIISAHRPTVGKMWMYQVTFLHRLTHPNRENNVLHHIVWNTMTELIATTRFEIIEKAEQYHGKYT